VGLEEKLGDVDWTERVTRDESILEERLLNSKRT
jgi:hypothetical protein